MRDLATKIKIVEFMRLFGRHTRRETKVYFTGGSTAVLHGWRDATLDIDLRFEPEPDELFRAIPEIKETLQINIELAAPSDFIPELPGWRDRSTYIGREGTINFYNYDPYSQALSKIERGHEQDVKDVASMFELGIIEPQTLASMFEQIEPFIYKYPAIDPKSFSAAVKRSILANNRT